MRLKAVFVLMACAGVSYAGENAVVERAAADIPAVLERVHQDAAAAAPRFRAAALGGMETTTDCRTFSFKENSPADSEPQDLRSETWLEECDNIPLPNPPGGGICLPRRRLLSVDMRTVRVRIVGRQVPGPKESFEVCLWGPRLSFRVRQSPNKYDVKTEEEPPFNSTYVLTRKK